MLRRARFLRFALGVRLAQHRHRLVEALGGKIGDALDDEELAEANLVRAGVDHQFANRLELFVVDRRRRSARVLPIIVIRGGQPERSLGGVTLQIAQGGSDLL